MVPKGPPLLFAALRRTTACHGDYREPTRSLNSPRPTLRRNPISAPASRSTADDRFAVAATDVVWDDGGSGRSRLRPPHDIGGDRRSMAKLMTTPTETTSKAPPWRSDGGTARGRAPGDDDFGSNSGAASRLPHDRRRRHVCRGGQADSLRRRAAGDFFGWSVAIDGDTIVVGARYDDDAGTSSGAAYVFRTTDGGATYTQVAKLTADDAGG